MMIMMIMMLIIDNDDDDGERVGVFFRSQLSCKAILAGWLFSAVFPILKINVSS